MMHLKYLFHGEGLHVVWVNDWFGSFVADFHCNFVRKVH